jgi:hypothetical protein
VVLSGATTPAQLTQNLEAGRVDGEAALERLDALVEPADRYWGERSRLPWH